VKAGPRAADGGQGVRRSGDWGRPGKGIRKILVDVGTDPRKKERARERVRDGKSKPAGTAREAGRLSPGKLRVEPDRGEKTGVIQNVYSDRPLWGDVERITDRLKKEQL